MSEVEIKSMSYILKTNTTGRKHNLRTTLRNKLDVI